MFFHNFIFKMIQKKLLNLLHSIYSLIKPLLIAKKFENSFLMLNFFVLYLELYLQLYKYLTK